MKLTDFDYILPPEHIAQYPAEPRDSSKLLCLSRQSGQIDDKVFRDIGDMLGENDVLVVNETKVINARLKGTIVQSSSKREMSEEQREQQCEIFLHKQISDNTWDCLVYPGKKLKPGTQVVFYNPSRTTPSSQSSPLKDKGETERSDNFEVEATQKEQATNDIHVALLSSKGEEIQRGGVVMEGIILSISDKGRIVEFSHGGQEFLDIIDTIGETPLPPYIKDHSSPAERYQTVYHDSQKPGSVAAPTAGLHFTPELIETLRQKGVQIEKVCLHVGLGTFANVEVEDIRDHTMHCEKIYISQEVAESLNRAKSSGKRIIAVGTTSVRTLESFSKQNGQLGHGSIDTNIFIYPGYEWRFVDSIITNFHLPKSTLLMLVSSFAGSENIKKAYQHAIDSRYRFFSFGDAMWIH